MDQQRDHVALLGDEPPEPIRKTTVVPLAVVAAFDRFTRDISRWWPLRTHSFGGRSTAGCVLEPRVGGRVFEQDRIGREQAWGEVLQWQPPHGLILRWAPAGVLAAATRLNLTFTPIAPGYTRLLLLHEGWCNADAEHHQDYDRDWDDVLHAYAEGIDAAISKTA